jgi:protein-S-isoprenylcysteine O-methyltransferase Ste14
VIVEEIAQRRGARGELYVLAQLGLLALIAWGPQAVDPGAAWPGLWGQAAWAVGMVLGLVGGLFAIAGVLHLGSNLSPWPRPKADSELVRSGAYSLVRHPIYTGLIFGSCGWALFVNGWQTLLYAFLLILLLDRKARYEEQWLRKKFDGYAGYQREVKRFVPFIY